MKVFEAINRIDSLKHNTYSQCEKVEWLNRLDGQIKLQIIDTHKGGEDVIFNGYTEKENMNTEDMRKFLSTKCGLLGMSKISNDMRDIENGNDKTVLNAYTYSVAKYISWVPTALPMRRDWMPISSGWRGQCPSRAQTFLASVRT